MRELTTGYEHHPGFGETGCPLQMTVNPSPLGTSSKGFACGRHGGHCLPNAKCGRWREEYLAELEALRQREEMLKLLEEQRRTKRINPAKRKDPTNEHG